jgi:acyl carrier protein
MSDMETRDKVRQIMGAVLQEPIAPDRDIVRELAPGWDSLKHVELLFALEDACDIKFDRQEFAELDSLDALVSAIDKHRACQQ